MGSEEPELVNTLEDGVRILRFNRPKRKNAINSKCLKSFKDALLEAGADPNTIITVITGTGDYFTSGNDLGNFSGMMGGNSTSDVEKAETDAEKLAEIRKAVGTFEEFGEILIKFPKPIIAVVNGPAVGMGVTLLALVDVVYASDRATFHTPFVSTAQSPELCSSYLFPRIMGPGKAAEMLVFSKKITAAEAYQHGLVTEVFPDNHLDEVWPRIREWAKLPPNSMANAKDLTKLHDREFLLKVNRLECDRLAPMFLKEEFIVALMNFFQRKSKL